MAIQTGLEGKPWYIGLAAGIGVAVALYFAAHVWLLKPKRQSLGAEEASLAALQGKIQQGRVAQAELPRFREDVRRLELSLNKLLRILPARRNTPDLLRRVRSLTEQGDFDFVRFTPGAMVGQEFYDEWSIGISLRGAYHNLALLFDHFSRLSRIINIENLELRSFGAPGSSHTLSASFKVKTFISRETPATETDTP